MKSIGIILAGGNNNRIGRLSDKRAIAALPVAGSYRAIDFTLSNMSNPTITKNNSLWYQGTADALYQNIDFLKKSHEPYVIIATGDGVYKMDYGKVLEAHIAKNADITVVYTTLKDTDDDLTRFGVLKLDENERIVEFEEKPLVASSNNVSIGVYVIRRRHLIEILERCAREDRHDFVQDVLVRYRNVRKIYGYKLDTYWRNIATVDSYYKTNMDFLKKDVRDYFFKQYPDVYSKVDDLPPAKYNTGAEVKNSIISSGCIVNGKVENCIVESRDTLRPGTNYVGTDDEVKIVIEKNVRYIL